MVSNGATCELCNRYFTIDKMSHFKWVCGQLADIDLQGQQPWQGIRSVCEHCVGVISRSQSLTIPQPAPPGLREAAEKLLRRSKTILRYLEKDGDETDDYEGSETGLGETFVSMTFELQEAVDELQAALAAAAPTKGAET